MAPSPDGDLYGLIDAQRLKIRRGVYSGLFITSFV